MASTEGWSLVNEGALWFGVSVRTDAEPKIQRSPLIMNLEKLLLLSFIVSDDCYFQVLILFFFFTFSECWLSILFKIFSSSCLYICLPWLVWLWLCDIHFEDFPFLDRFLKHLHDHTRVAVSQQNLQSMAPRWVPVISQTCKVWFLGEYLWSAKPVKYGSLVSSWESGTPAKYGS